MSEDSEGVYGAARQNMENARDVQIPESVEDWLWDMSARKADSTVERRRGGIKYFLEFWEEQNGDDEEDGGDEEDEEDEGIVVDPGDVTEVDVRNCLTWISRQDYSDATIKSAYYSVKKWLDFCVEREIIDKTPVPDEAISLSGGGWIDSWDSTEKSKQTKEGIHWIKPEQKEALIEGIERYKIRNELLVRLMWQTGMRQEEIRTIDTRDIDHDEHSIQIRSNKAAENRTVFYQPSLQPVMTQWVVDRQEWTSSEDSDRLFVTQKSGKMTKNRINNLIKSMAENAGIQRVMYSDAGSMNRNELTGHTLRHSFAVQSLENGMDVRTLQKAMGHENISTTEKYLDLTNRQVKNSMRMYGAGSENRK